MVEQAKNQSTIMAGFPPPPNERFTLENWDRPPMNRWSFQNIRRILPTANVARAPAGAVVALDYGLRDLDAVFFESSAGQATTISEFLDGSFTDGFIVLQGGQIVIEHYDNGMTPAIPHLAQSVSKSVVGITAGILIDQGHLDPAAPLRDTIPELSDCGYREATVQHVLDMTSGVRFNEDYTDPDSDVSDIDRACGWKPARPGSPDCLCDVILRLEQERPHGEIFNYRSIETEVLAWAMQRATGRDLADLVGGELWSKLGTEQDAYFTVDRVGMSLADGGFNATLRDFARFGQMILQGGHFGDRQIVSDSWIEACRSGNHAIFGEPFSAILPDGAYSNQFWIEDSKRRAIMARGVFGQLIYIDFEAQMVAVKLSTWPEFQNPMRSIDTLRALGAIRQALTETTRS